MQITLDWLHVVVLVAAVQGLMLAGVLATRRRNRTANRVLAVAMVAFTVYLATSTVDAAGLLVVLPHFMGAAYLMPFLYDHRGLQGRAREIFVADLLPGAL